MLGLRVTIATLMLTAVVPSIGLLAQDIEEVIKAKPISFSGGISANTTFYKAYGIENRRDPFYWIVNANVNFDFFGVVSAPFSMSISQQNKSFQQPQPFNQYGMSPKYKAVTAHLGHRSMNFSSYTLAGNLFFGAGVEVEPKDSFYRVSAMYGRFAKPVNKTSSDGLVFSVPTYRRLGYGVKVGLGPADHNVDLIIFKASDDENSIFIEDSVTTISAEENLVLGFNTKHKFGKRISVDIEYAYSMFTRDKKAQEVVINEYTFVNNFGLIYAPNSSSEFNTALSAKVQYSGEGYQVSGSYRKIDPGFQTMGSSFLNNDIRDISGGLSWGMFKQKVNIGINSGLQQNNLEDQLSAEIYRLIYGGNINYTPNQSLNFSLNYSNFNSSTRQSQLQTDILVDSLEFFQISRSGSFAVNYRMNREAGLNHNLFFTSNIQDATDSENNASTFINLTIGHQVNIGDGWALSTSYTYNDNQSNQLNNVTTGPVLGLNKSFFENKLSTSLSGNMMYSYLDDELQNKIYNLRNTYALRAGEKHSFSMSVYYLNSSTVTEEKSTVEEIRGNLGYSYRF